MPRPRPACGSKNGYHAHNRRGEDPCDACAEASRLYHREYYRATARIRHPDRHLVDAKATREAIREALARGVTLSQIDRETGYNTQGLGKLRDGLTKRCMRGTQDKIVAACERLAPKTRQGFQPVEVTALRLHAIHDSGATWRWIAEHLGASESQIDRVAYRRQEMVSDDFARRVEDLMVKIGQGEVRAPGMVDRGQSCRAGCGAFVDYGTCVRCRKRAQRERDRERRKVA